MLTRTCRRMYHATPNARQRSARQAAEANWLGQLAFQGSSLSSAAVLRNRQLLGAIRLTLWRAGSHRADRPSPKVSVAHDRTASLLACDSSDMCLTRRTCRR